jgi:Fic family protein
VNQPIAHRWAPIEDLPADREGLASDELRSLSEIWVEQQDLLKGSGALRDFNSRLQRRWAIETGIIERIYTLDRGTTELLIEHGIDASLIPHDATNRDPELVATIIRDQQEAVDLLFEFVKGDRSLSTSFVKELHALITQHQETATGIDQFGRRVEVPLLHGEWKRWPNNPTRPDGSVHEYCPPEQVSSEMDRLLELHAQHAVQGLPPEVEAAWLHHRFVEIHPFQDGNGRVVRALASLVLIKAGWFPLVITRDDREPYIGALEQADDGDLRPLVSLFARLQKHAFVNALGLAREVLHERERVDQVIASIGELFAERHEALRQEWERAKQTADGVLVVAREKLEAVAANLRQQVGRHSTDYRFFVDSEPNTGSRRRWYRWQATQTARKLDYFANFNDYSAWARLCLGTETQADVVLSLTGIGHEYRGLIGASLSFFRREEVEDGESRAVDLTAATDDLFQVNYKEPEESVLARFERWLDQGLVRALEIWRQGL